MPDNLKSGVITPSRYEPDINGEYFDFADHYNAVIIPARSGKSKDKEIAEELEDDHSLGAFRAIVDKISEQQIRIFLSIIKDTHLTGKIKRSRGAMFISLAKEYAAKNNINLNFK
ncbi:MAG: hypothetical protein IMZ60_01545 [Actinobacteria bacterium]|nr:hypothetical protein [Chloroflexota bacterium]MBE3128342.1 hypothetical protein [Actinomycetota bacterium]